MSVRRSAPGATPTGSGEPASVSAMSGPGRGLRWRKSRKSSACSFGSTARFACTWPAPGPAVTPVSLPRRMSARISRGWRTSIGMTVFYDASWAAGRLHSLRENHSVRIALASLNDRDQTSDGGGNVPPRTDRDVDVQAIVDRIRERLRHRDDVDDASAAWAVFADR